MEDRDMEDTNPHPRSCQCNSELREIYQQCTPVPASRFRQFAPRKYPLQGHEYEGCENHQHAWEGHRLSASTEAASILFRYGTSELVPFPINDSLTSPPEYRAKP